ncbi:MAG TPA: GNAT family N-acetyltransferase [Rhabdochlamydiaceae bacterium]|jgi:putative acetyltransferase
MNEKHKDPLTFRLSSLEDGHYLARWLSEPSILRWFPMYDAREIDDAVRIWLSYSRIHACLTADWEGKPCGLANLYIQPFKKLAHTSLFSIIVQKEFRNKGIGARLLEELMKLAKRKFHIEILHLEVYEGNPAKKLYERMGFVEFGYQTHFIKEETGYLGKFFMQKVL